MTEDLQYLSIAEAGARIKARKLSPVDLTEAFLSRIESYDGALHTYVRAMPEAARAAAKAAEVELSAGNWRGPLHGIPFGVKDIYDVRGVPTTCQSAFYKDHSAQADAFAVECLKSAGAIILGKQTTWEFAVGAPGFDCPWPPARNPWDLSRDPGGSSSGPGAAVAAGLCTAALGSDTGGSVRFPAAYCGVSGFKPTYGLVSARGMFPLAFSLDHAGVLARSSADCAAIMQVISAPDPQGDGINAPRPDFSAPSRSMKGLRIGIMRNFFGGCVQTYGETAAAVEAAAVVFRDLGAEVRDVTIPPLRQFSEAGVLISRCEGYALHEANLRKAPHLYAATSRTRLMLGSLIRAADYINAQRHRTVLLQDMARIHETFDLLIGPTVPTVAPLLETEDPEDARNRLMFTRVFNMTGAPVVSVCTGFGATGLPLAMQIAGRPFEDDLVLAAGAAFETATGHHLRHPTAFTGVRS